MHLDSWAKKAKSNGYRSRAVFKLEEILRKIKFTNTDGKVLDIGSSPGGWSQYIIKNFPKKEVYAIDVLDMKSIDGVCFVKEDIHNIDEIETVCMNKLSEFCNPEYFEIRNANDLSREVDNCSKVRAFTAVHFGRIRLIDNIELN